MSVSDLYSVCLLVLHARITKVLLEGSNSDKVMFFIRGERIQIAMAFSWQADDGPTLNAGLVAV